MPDPTIRGVYKHGIFTRVEELLRAPERRRRLAECFRSGADLDDVLAFLQVERVLDANQVYAIKNYEPWRETASYVCSKFWECLPQSSHLDFSGWLVAGVTDHVHVNVEVTHTQVLFLVLTPGLPTNMKGYRADVDPDFVQQLRDQHGELGAALDDLGRGRP